MEPLLLVEDKPELRAMLRKALERAGYAVDEAAGRLDGGQQDPRAALFAGAQRSEAARVLGSRGACANPNRPTPPFPSF